MMKCSFFASLPALLFAVACSAASDDSNTVVDADLPPAQPAVLIDSIQWNNEKLDFFDSPSDDGSPSEVLVTMLAPNNGPELLLTLEDQLGRTPTAAEIYLAAGGSLDDVPEELLTAHEVVAEQEGLSPTPEKPEIDADRVQEKTITQPIFNQMFPLSQVATGLGTIPAGTCWDALATEVDLKHLNKRVCTGNGNAVVNFDQTLNCDPVLNQNATIRAATFPFAGNGRNARICFGTGGAAESCNAITFVPVNNFFGSSFIKNGQKHRLGVGVFGQPGTGNDSIFAMGTANLSKIAVPQFMSTTCTAHVF